ncbi:MAG: ABC transporter permease [Afipia sp.]|nr:ABC transporter permease [Afipia sp.]
MSEIQLQRSNRQGIAPHRIGAMILRHWYLLTSSWPRLLELIYWRVLQLITWGFSQAYISQNAGFFAKAGGTFIGAVILWDILFRGQLGFSMSFLEEMWSKNLGNLLMSPLKVLFGFGLALVAFFCNLIFTSWSFGLISSGLVLRNGMGAEGLAWTLMFALLPLTCVYYPVSVLPGWLQVVAWMLPPTYVFEGMRALLIDKVFRADLMIQAFAINVALFAISTVAFLLLLKSARKHGSLVQSGE